MDFADLVIAWFSQAARDLPWRSSRTTPWAVLVSEIMLQQTPVIRVLPAYGAWMIRWPTPVALAEDSPGEAVRMWAKLGYPRRALRLHACAVELVERFDGQVPDNVEDLLSLPGVGDYTARAVATFAFGQRHPVVDTNVRRVVARAIAGQAEAGPPSTLRDLAALEQVLPPRLPAAAIFSAGMMELGALVCTARAPRCVDCPVAVSCRWRHEGYPAYNGPVRATQRFAGTDRQVRGRLMDVLRAAPGPVTVGALDVAWSEPTQRGRALDTLIVDGLVDPLPDGRYALPGHRGLGPTGTGQ